MARVVGEQQLMARLRAVGVNGSEGIMKLAAAYTRGYMVRNMPRKTGLTAASLHPSVLGPTRAIITGSPVAVWLDSGTGLYGPMHRKITPKAALALAFYVGNRSSLRLSGRPRAGKAGAGASLVVVRSVKGMKARPYINRSVAEAAQKVGGEIGSQIITHWNEAK